jgi:hypothetical protein
MAVALVLSAYAGVVDENHRASAGPRPRAASTPIVVVSSSYDATVRVPRPPPTPVTAVIVDRSRRRCGRYVP